MRILLATAVAIAPLMAASGAAAEVVISTARTTPITTSNATGSGADSIRIASGGAINVTSGAAITLDSGHSVDIDSGGAIGMTVSENGSTAILVNGGNQANVFVGGNVTVTDQRESALSDLDVDKDGDADGPLATGTGRFGLRVAPGGGAHTGDINVERSGVIQVEGNNSGVVSIEAPLIGNVNIFGGGAVVGDNSTGFRSQAVTGNVTIMGSMSARGENSVAASIEGDVSGRLLIGSNMSASGFRFTGNIPERPANFVETANNDDNLLFLDELDADDLLIGGPALRIAGNVAGGVVLDVAPIYSSLGIEGDDDGDGVKNGDEDNDGDGIANRNDTDRDGDGIADLDEGSAQIVSYGPSPALQVGSATQSVTLGGGAGAPQYGMVNRGTVVGDGVYSGYDSAGVSIGGFAGQTATVAGGLLNEGTIRATTVDGNATAVRLGAGASVPTIVNSGNITATAEGDVTGKSATAIQIGAGATVNSLQNSGVIAAGTSATTFDMVAVRDLSGTLREVTNTRSILAGSTAEGVTAASIALDLTANTSGVTLIQSGTAAAGTDSDGDGVPDTREPLIRGAVRLGSGADVVDIRNGSVNGDISFGAGADSLSISGGAVVTGALSDSDGLLSVNVSNGVLTATQTSPLNLSQLSVGGAGDLIVGVDPATFGVGTLNVSGAATLADGAGLGVRFSSLLQQPGRYTLIDAATLNVGQLDNLAINENSPFLYVVTVGTDVPAGQVFADIRRRTAGEAALIPVEAAAFDAFYGVLGQSGAETIRDVFLAQTNRADFINLYEQLLPEHSGGSLLSLSSGVDAVTRALVGRNATAAPGQTSAWVQEINFYADKDKTDTYGFRSEGFGLAGGVERMTGVGAVGVSAAFTSSDLEDPEAEAEEVLTASLLELGVYWRAQGQRWTTWARAAAGYAMFESQRRFVGGGLNLSNEADWKGFSLAAAAGASYEQSFGRLSIRPEAYVEYFGLNENGYSESGGGDGFDLEVDDREGHLLSATAAINLGWSMGADSWLKPELRVGWRQNISVDPGETIARFRAGGGDFVLSPDSIEGGGPIAGLRLNVGNELGMLSVSADAEMINDYIRYMLFLRASFRF